MSNPEEPKRENKWSISEDSHSITHINEPEYRFWWTKQALMDWFCSIHQDHVFNQLLCVGVLAMLVLMMVQYNVEGTSTVDIAYNVLYGVYVLAVMAAAARKSPNQDVTFSEKVGFLMDLVSYLHYAVRVVDEAQFKLICYYIRLHRPFRYIWAVDKNKMEGSLLVTTLKFIYICLVLRVSCAYLWLNLDPVEIRFTALGTAVLKDTSLRTLNDTAQLLSPAGREFFVALYIVNKIFIPVGPSVFPNSDLERLAFLVIMLIGCLVVSGAAVASMSSVISIYMRPEEDFRTRYRLIIQEMSNSQIPQSLHNKVETFYKMYWHKQRAVSATQLLPTFPHVLPKSILTEIYFEATQKSRILRDLSYQFLSELALKMETIHYIPGDSIIKRNSKKDSIIFIAYGDIEMLTAEDDITPILRFTRGTILTQFGVCPSGGGRAHVEIRAATFCTAHVLRTEDLWRVALKHGGARGQTVMIFLEFLSHMDKVKKHYSERIPHPTKYKSSILHFKRSLMALKAARNENGELLLARSDYLLEIAGCYIMRNRADASLTDDADAICLRQTFPCILQPGSSLLIAWHWLVAVLILVVCFTHPYNLVFKKTKTLEFKFFDALMTGIYVLDIVTYLSTGSNVEEGVPITFVQTSAQQVTEYWFVLDVLATVPIFEFIGDGSYAGINKILRLPKVFHMMKLLESAYVYHSNIIRFLSYSLLLVIACFVIAAVQQGFMCNLGYCIVTNFTHQPYWTYAPLDDESVLNRVIFGLYWATSLITFTAHLESWGMQKLSIAAFTMLVLEAAIFLHVFIQAVYSATIMVTTAFREDYDACITNVKNFLTRNNVCPQLRQRFITYLQLCWYTDKAYSMTMQQTSVFYDLPPHVNHDILARQRSKYILCIPFMKLLHKEDLENISSDARMFCTSPNEILLNTGDISNEMYVIKQGICEILSPDTREVVGTLVAKSNFGVLECLLRLPAFYTVRTLTHVQLFSVSRKHLVRAIELPQIKEAIDFAKEQEEYFRLQLRREPFVFYSPPPPAPTLEQFRLPRKHETDYAFLQPFNKLGFFSTLRYVFPRKTIRPDSEFLTRYEILRAVCAFLSAMLFPCYSYLSLQFPWLQLLKILLDFLAYIDVVGRMYIGYFNSDGLLVYHPASTAAHYLKGAFIVDLLGCLPLDLLEASREHIQGNYYQVTMTKQMLMMNRLLQLYRLPGALSVLLGNVERQDYVIVLKATPLYLMMLNALTSVLIFSSVSIFEQEQEGAWAIFPLPDNGGSWLNLYNKSFHFNLTESPLNLQLGCFFWVVYETTCTGYNSLHPSNHDIMNVLFLAMVMGTLVATYVSVRIISIRANVNKTVAAYQEHMKDLVQYMRGERLSESLQKELVDYYEYNWDRTGGVDYRHVLKLCDQITLRTDAILHLYGPTFANCPILASCDVSLLRILGRAVHSVYFLRQTTIYEENDIIQDLFIVDSGSLDITLSGEEQTVHELSIGSVFGNLDCKPAAAMPAAVVAMTDVHLLQMSSLAFHHIVRDCDFPEVSDLMRAYRPYNETFIQGGVEESETETLQQRKHSVIDITRRRRLRLLDYLRITDSVWQTYMMLIAMVCIYTDVYNAGFQDNSSTTLQLLYVLDFGFLITILVHFILPYVSSDAHFRDLLGRAKTKYVREEFLYDLASCVPVEVLCFFLSEGRWMLFSWLRLNRMLRIVRVNACVKYFKERVTANLLFTTIVLVLWFTLFVHVAACLWHFLAVFEDMGESKQSWMYDGQYTEERVTANLLFTIVVLVLWFTLFVQVAACLWHFLGIFEDMEQSWMYDDEGETLCNNHYICSLYFVLTTFTQSGIGDIMPKDRAEVLFVSVLQILSMMVYMVYVGEFSNIIQYASFRSFSYYRKYLELQDFLRNNRVSSTLVRLVNKYTVHLWQEARGEQLPHFLITAPRCLKFKVMSAAYMKELDGNPVFKNCDPALLRHVVGYLRHYYYHEDMYVVKEGEITDAMYLVHVGKVEELSEGQAEDSPPKIYGPGEYFGVLQGIVRDTPYSFSYRTMIKSQVLTLRLKDWEYLLEYFPVSKEAIHKFQDFSGDDDDSHKDGLKQRSNASSTSPGGLSYKPKGGWPCPEHSMSELPKGGAKVRSKSVSSHVSETASFKKSTNVKSRISKTATSDGLKIVSPKKSADGTLKVLKAMPPRMEEGSAPKVPKSETLRSAPSVIPLPVPQAPAPGSLKDGVSSLADAAQRVLEKQKSSNVSSPKSSEGATSKGLKAQTPRDSGNTPTILEEDLIPVVETSKDLKSVTSGTVQGVRDSKASEIKKPIELEVMTKESKDDEKISPKVIPLPQASAPEALKDGVSSLADAAQRVLEKQKSSNVSSPKSSEGETSKGLEAPTQRDVHGVADNVPEGLDSEMPKASEIQTTIELEGIIRRGTETVSSAITKESKDDEKISPKVLKFETPKVSLDAKGQRQSQEDITDRSSPIGVGSTSSSRGKSSLRSDQNAGFAETGSSKEITQGQYEQTSHPEGAVPDDFKKSSFFKSLKGAVKNISEYLSESLPLKRQTPKTSEIKLPYETKESKELKLDGEKPTKNSLELRTLSNSPGDLETNLRASRTTIVLKDEEINRTDSQQSYIHGNLKGPLITQSSKQILETNLADERNETDLEYRPNSDLEIEDPFYQLRDTSSTELFEKIRLTAMAIENENSVFSMDTEKGPMIDKKSLEDYLVDKYNMKESYAIDFEDDSEDYNESSFSDGGRKPRVNRNVRMKIEDESSKAVDRSTDSQNKERRASLLKERIAQFSGQSVSHDQNIFQGRKDERPSVALPPGPRPSTKSRASVTKAEESSMNSLGSKSRTKTYTSIQTVEAPHSDLLALEHIVIKDDPDKSPTPTEIETKERQINVEGKENTNKSDAEAGTSTNILGNTESERNVIQESMIEKYEKGESEESLSVLSTKEEKK